jgi:hypothetical protein
MLVLFPKICPTAYTVHTVNIIILSHHLYKHPGIKHFTRNTSIENPTANFSFYLAPEHRLFASSSICLLIGYSCGNSCRLTLRLLPQLSLLSST